MLVHLSDLHFGTEQPECIRALEAFCAQHQPEAIVVSGDLTQRARFKQFYNCRQFLDRLKCPYLVVPGNHDIPLFHLWNRFFSPFARYQLFFGNMEMTLETEHFFLVGVNSIRRRYHTRGHISLSQITRVDQHLQQAPQHKLKYVVAHQPFYIPPQDKEGVKDCPVLGRMALQTWAKNGLNGLLHGHLHQSARYDLNDIYQLECAHPIWDIHAGTATSHRLHHGVANSFNTLDIHGNMQSYVFDTASQQFRLAQQFEALV